MLERIKETYRTLFASVGASLVLVFVVFGCIILSIFTVLSYHIKYDEEVELLNKRLSNIPVSYVNPLSLSLWRYDEDTTKIIVESILKHPDVEQVVIYKNNKPVMKVGKEVEEQYAIGRSFPLTKQEQGETFYLGDLKILASKENMLSRLQNNLFNFIFAETVKVFVVLISLLLFLKLIVTRHLDAIRSFLGTHNIYENKTSLRLNREFEFWKTVPDDFDLLVDTINSMNAKLQKNLHDRMRAESELRQLNENLESRVLEKTKELLDSDRIGAVVEMSAGIAHEVNSPLSVVYSLKHRIEKKLIMDHGNLDDNTVQMLKMMDKSIQRIFSITSTLQALSTLKSSADHIEKDLAADLVNEVVRQVKDVFRTSEINLEFTVADLQKEISLNKNFFIQLLYILIHIRTPAIRKSDADYLRFYFSLEGQNFNILCYDGAKSFSDEEISYLKDPFKTLEDRSRGSMLLFSTLASLVKNLKGQVLFKEVDDLVIQIQIPVGTDET